MLVKNLWSRCCYDLCVRARKIRGGSRIFVKRGCTTKKWRNEEYEYEEEGFWLGNKCELLRIHIKKRYIRFCITVKRTGQWKKERKESHRPSQREGGAQPLHPPPRSALEDSLTRKRNCGTLPWPVIVFLKAECYDELKQGRSKYFKRVFIRVTKTSRPIERFIIISQQIVDLVMAQFLVTAFVATYSRTFIKLTKKSLIGCVSLRFIGVLFTTSCS